MISLGLILSNQPSFFRIFSAFTVCMKGNKSVSVNYCCLLAATTFPN
uniref:Uncharacterized protein n=1 Tax=Arundo donax TaxID=35708 RepID=A0A0A9AI97_ARUDO